MAQDVRTKIYLGYEDEYIVDKHRSLVNFTTNKIGGSPDWHNEQMTLTTPQCRLCGLHQLLTLQIYAPLDSSKYHRTLYIFACMNPNCWNQNESWTCLRVQSLEQPTNTDSSSCVTVQTSTTSWLADADDWGDNWNDNVSERNGNNLLMKDPNKYSISTQNTNYEEELKAGFSELQVDDPNANSPTSMESPVGVGAVGRLDAPHASAEIEGEESEVVCIDTPTQPHCDLISLLQEVTPLPVQHTESKGKNSLTFTEIFISVEEEYETTDVPQHVRDLFMEYQRSNPDMTAGEASGETSDDSKGYGDSGVENYEKSIPKHGDEMFHNFVSRIQKNPGQILRYSRDNSAPLLLYPIGGCIGRCRHCGDEMSFELQILPTLIPKLKLNARSDQPFQIEFGTILIFTCIRSCWSVTDSYREEHIIVQAERL